MPPSAPDPKGPSLRERGAGMGAAWNMGATLIHSTSMKGSRRRERGEFASIGWG